MEIINSFEDYEIIITHQSEGDMRISEHLSNIIRPYPQDHGTNLAKYTGGPSRFSHVDGIYTELSNVNIGALCADCPILIFMGKGEIAAIHSGWRGTKAHIVRQALRYFKKTNVSDIKVFIGPHIQKESYEVQKDFLDHFPAQYFLGNDEILFFDIEKYLVDDLIALGLLRENIISHGSDTYSDSRYFSYRRDGMIGLGCVSVKML